MSENKTYSWNEAFDLSLDYFNGNVFAADIFLLKYALRDLDNELLEATPKQMFERVGREFARIEAKYPNAMSYGEIMSYIDEFTYLIPQGSPLSAIGDTSRQQSLSNCFIIDSPHDSYAGILHTDQEQAQIMKRRGGVGCDVSTLRPKDMVTSNAARTTDGIKVFVQRYSNTCGEVAQNGRRGALLMSLLCVHPEVESFITVKRDLGLVTNANISVKWTDEFMHAVERDQEFTLRWPVDAPEGSEKNTKRVSAKSIWGKFVDSAWGFGEPGSMFWDTIIRETPTQLYAKEGFQTLTTNPCLTGDVQIAVADGRGYVTIKELADEGRDVFVYAYDNDSQKLVIKKMRNPRVTGINVPVYRVTTEGGHSFCATQNHTMIMRDGTRKTVEELRTGDSLWIANKVTARFSEALPQVAASTSQKYHWVKDCNRRSWKTEHRLVWEAYNERAMLNGEVIHHINHDALDNSIENLRCMSKVEHDELHSCMMRGKNNPIYKIKADPDRFAVYRQHLSTAMSGVLNGNAYDVTNEELHEHIRSLTRQVGRRVKASEWKQYALEHGLPQNLVSYRTDDMPFIDFLKKVAYEEGISSILIEHDPRMVERAKRAIADGYKCKVENDRLYVERTCEQCGAKFWTSYDTREIAFCDARCSQLYSYTKNSRREIQTQRIREVHASKAVVTMKKQLDVFTSMRAALGRNPTCTEWALECKRTSIPMRLGTKYGFKDWDHIVNDAKGYNHRVVSVEYVGEQTVYNGTVDDVHTLCFKIGEEHDDRFESNVDVLLASEQCGEIILSRDDSCRLLAINSTAYVDDPFLPTASFDFEKFAAHVRIGQRLLDDLIDLEIEAIDNIIKKVENDPEPMDVKLTELNLWKRVRVAAVNGRRSGLGQTGIGDVIAMLGMRYGSDESIAFVEKFYKMLAVNAHASSIILARERGAFPVWESGRDKGHPFMDRLKSAMVEVLGDEGIVLNTEYEEIGRRNIGLTTTSPGGSISEMAKFARVKRFGVTSGIESTIFINQIRRRKLQSTEDSARVDFVDDLGIKWQEYERVHAGFDAWRKITGQDDVKLSPYASATCVDVDWMKSIEIVAVAQRWVEHSISKTVNMPADASKELVSDAYFMAWKLGCKGLTVYRIGSRNDVIRNKDDKTTSSSTVQPKQIVESHAPKRPKTLDCDVHKCNVKGESWTIFVGLLDDKPYEIFGGLSKYVEIPRRVKKARITKVGKRDATYNLEWGFDEDTTVIKDIVDTFDSPTNGAFTRTLSLSLRHGIPVQYICEQLQKDKNSDMFSFSRVMARVLKNYIPDGTQATGQRCPDCGASVNYNGGCTSCTKCSWMKCG